MIHEFGQRIGLLQSAMVERNIDATLLSVGSDLPYFVGYQAMMSERLTMLVVPSADEPTLVMPVLEAPRMTKDVVRVHSWGDGEDPVGLVANLLGGQRFAVGDHTWSVFLIELQRQLSEASWTSATEMTSELRMRKSPSEVAVLRKAAHQADAVARRVPTEIRFAGSSERAIGRKLSRMLEEEGHDDAEFAIVGSGPNGASPHHEPTDRVVAVGDVVVLDFGGSLDGYKSDTTRTFVVGSPSNEQREIHDVVAAANDAGRKAIRPGVECQEVDAAARRVIEDAGYGRYFIHRTGHGIGLEVHEHPYIVAGNRRMLEPGMAFSVEPGIYLTGKCGVRIEDIVVCGEAEVDELNNSDRSLVEVV